MLAALAEHGEDYPVARVMRRNFPSAQSGEMLDSVFQRLRECGCSALPVFRNGWLVGLITTDNVGEYLLIEATLQKHGLQRDSARTDPFGDSVEPPHSVSSERV